MKLFQRISILFFALWLLIGQIGFAFQSKKCLVTGSKKWSISKNIICCKRNVSSPLSKQFSFSKSTCCAYNQYVIKFNFSVEKLKSYAWLPLAPCISRHDFANLCGIDERQIVSIFAEESLHPPSRSVRLAFLQTYLI